MPSRDRWQDHAGAGQCDDRQRCSTFPRSQHSPYVDQYNLDFQYSFAKSFLADVAYIGNNAHYLAVNWNPFDCSVAGRSVLRRSRNPYNGRYTYMQEVNSIGYSNYNALLAKLQHQFQHGFSLIANYIMAKGDGAEAQQGSNGTVNQDRSCLRCDYGLTTSNIPQALSISAVADVPFGRGRHWGNAMNPALDESGGRMERGCDLHHAKGPAIHHHRRQLHCVVSRPNQREPLLPQPSCRLVHCLRMDSTRISASTASYWFWNQQANGVFQNETSGGCFVDPAKDPANLVNGKLPVINGVQARDAFGDGGFDPFYGPGLNNWDIAAHKEFNIAEGIKFAVRGEFFNAWNHTQFANPNTGVNGGTNFGQITATQHASRIVQVAGKITF